MSVTLLLGETECKEPMKSLEKSHLSIWWAHTISRARVWDWTWTSLVRGPSVNHWTSQTTNMFSTCSTNLVLTVGDLHPSRPLCRPGDFPDRCYYRPHQCRPQHDLESFVNLLQNSKQLFRTKQLDIRPILNTCFKQCNSPFSVVTPSRLVFGVFFYYFKYKCGQKEHVFNTENVYLKQCSWIIPQPMQLL